MRYADVPARLQTRRVVSVDAVRGFNIFWIIGADGAVLDARADAARQGPGRSALWANFLGTQMTHAALGRLPLLRLHLSAVHFHHGCFDRARIAAAGRARGKGESPPARAAACASLVCAGHRSIMAVSASSWSDIRFVGVLQRIAVCYLFASILFLNLDLARSGWRGYRVAGGLLGAADIRAGARARRRLVRSPKPISPTGSILHYLPGRLWDETRDPEGLLSTLPAIGTCVLGVLAGLLLKDERIPPATKKSLWLIGGGIAMIAAGYLWGLQFPIIKAIWTSSFVLVAGGYSMILLAVSHQVIDVWGWKSWATPFVWIGANAIMLYFINGIVGFAALGVSSCRRRRRRLWLSSVTTPGTGAFLAHIARACVRNRARRVSLSPQDFPARVNFRSRP